MTQFVFCCFFFFNESSKAKHCRTVQLFIQKIHVSELQLMLASQFIDVYCVHSRVIVVLQLASKPRSNNANSFLRLTLIPLPKRRTLQQHIQSELNEASRLHANVVEHFMVRPRPLLVFKSRHKYRVALCGTYETNIVYHSNHQSSI